MRPILLLAVTLTADPWVTGPKLASEWDRPLTAVFENTEFRDVLHRLGPDRNLAVILDRRIDPNQTVTFSIQQEPLRLGLARIVASRSAELVLTENVAYVGPTERARWLRTAIIQAERGMATESTKRLVPVRKTIAWDDLATPRSILERIEAAYNLRVDNPALVPHDLWGRATLPNVTPAEALTLVLIQFDLRWTWEPKSRRVQLEPWDNPDPIDRSFQPRGKMTVASVLEDGPVQWPEVKFTARDKDVLVRGRVEDLEQVAKWLAGGLNRIGPKDGPSPTPLSQRRFTLSEKNVPALAVLKELEKTGVELVLDEDSLAAAGADLNRLVTIAVQKATIDEFLKAVLDPVHAVAEVEGLTITIRGKP